MSLTRKPGKAAASSDVNPRKGTASLKEEQVVSRRPPADRRAELQQWRQKKLEERNNSAGKVMPTSSRRRKENNIKVSRSPVFSMVLIFWTKLQHVLLVQ